MEDVLDDWKTAVQQLQTADRGVETSTTSVRKRKVCPFASCFSFGSKVVRRHEIATRIKDINEELEQIVKDKDKFELVKREIIKLPKLPESTSFVDVSKLCGRDGEKEDIIRRLLCGTSEEEEGISIPTITIVGMGGIGKTALGQLIYSDPRIQTHFDKKIWVCVSDPFDLSQIARAILEGLDSTISLQNTTPLQTLLSKINENIKDKKFFLVLDDVWKDHGQDWEQLKATFQSVMLGSRILVTSRKDSVAKHLESSHVFHLDLLSEEICWLILSQKAFTGRNQIGRENLEDIGREIAKKCKGLPLAAITLGGLLQDKLRSEEWENVLNSEIWKLDFARQYIYAPLLLSYFDLPSAIRRCFLYCAIFPKDYVISNDELVQHWMAQGYLNSDDNLGAELTGKDYFKCLASRSLFQDFAKDANGDIICCKMHDIVHDFVQFLTKCGFVTEKIVEDLTLDLSSKKPRHLRLVIENCSSSPMSIYGIEKLRSLVAVCHGFDKIASEASHNLLSKSKHLRLLELCSFCLDAKGIARDMGNWIHLRYLCLKLCYGIEILPEPVCELPNLQSLNIENCFDLKKLPVGIEKLINLRYLCTEGCFELTYYPKGISNLTSLMRLSNIKLRADCNDADRFSIGDLENLDLLGGNLCVELQGNSIDREEAKRAKLHKKTHLKRMEIWICSPHIKKEEVVQALNPPSNLPVVLLDYEKCA
ncbi:putative disease resistance protein RGA3 [Durio zibethinus]|uniref:Disease resistance protein RGA3 n=1 Tax=Durio zibethinus TaxID=66656 RepID=A0A6P5YU94_DURZI|nr:putative disease resistance protein RGA3 [Durio zibethinus]